MRNLTTDIPFVSHPECELAPAVFFPLVEGRFQSIYVQCLKSQEFLGILASIDDFCRQLCPSGTTISQV